MTKVAQEELSRLDDSITECNILYLPQVKIKKKITSFKDVMTYFVATEFQILRKL